MICAMVTLPWGLCWFCTHALSLRYQKEAVHFTKTLHRQRRRRGLGIALQFDHTAATGLATRQRLGSGGRLAIHMALYTCQGER
jgi:hypothetical protein